MISKTKIFLFFLVRVLFINAQQLEKKEEVRNDSVYQLQEVVVASRQILGSKFQARNRTGSAYYISPEEIRKFGYTDINRMLKAIPGVNMYEEDGFGLRPNISLRGTKAERSERISIMEDGILAAPAPYSAPAAYYFPNAARMEAVEVLKGSSQVQYGPFTTGGLLTWYRLLYLILFPVRLICLMEAKTCLNRIHTLEICGSTLDFWWNICVISRVGLKNMKTILSKVSSEMTL